jgi:sigma-B regulation protein RsbU (phosphoserine phosphatase)
MLCREFSVVSYQLSKGDRLVLFTDGLSEAQDRRGIEFGVQPLIELAKTRQALSSDGLVRSLIAQAAEFRSNAPERDDLTLMVIEWVA